MKHNPYLHVLLYLLPLWTSAYISTLISTHHQHPRRPTCHDRTNTALFGRKKGTLGENVSAGSIPKKKENNRTMKNANTSNSEKKGNVVKISSSLSEWAKTLGGEQEQEETTRQSSLVSSATKNDDVGVGVGSSNDENDTVTNYKSFDRESSSSSSSSSSKKSSVVGKNSSRRERTNIRQVSIDAKVLQIKQQLDDITDLISSKNLPVEDLVSKIKALTQLPSPVTLKALLNQKAKDYTLAWVGSDEAICHIGTGLHKVPLARLQDIFITIGRDGGGESKTFRLMEVIRILGPFPNVRNTLEGKVTKINSQEYDNGDDDVALKNSGALRKDTIQICYDSIMDGLGKQINAGTVDNLRFVDLEVLFADEQALVCVVPPNLLSNKGDDDSNDTVEGTGTGLDRIGEKGENVLLFLQEKDLDYKLEELRAA